MTRENKELLLKDICARLPYGVKISIPDLWISSIKNIEVLNEIFKGDDGLCRVNDSGILIEYVKPYLRTMSSMTPEEKKYIKYKWGYSDWDTLNDFINYTLIDTCDAESFIDWLNENYFDYRGLIEKGLALPAPESMYKI